MMWTGWVGRGREGRREVRRLEVGERGLRAAEPAAAEPQPASAEALLVTKANIIKIKIQEQIHFFSV